jgi:alpha-L-rhamnosidase
LRARSERALNWVATRLASPYGSLTSERPDDPWMSQYISPYIGSEELLARFRLGDAQGAMDLLRRTWFHMLSVDPETTMWEKLTPDGEVASYSPNQIGNNVIPSDFPALGRGTASMAHAWSGGPVPALSGYVAGLRPAASGWRRWIVAPQLAGLRWAQGRVRTPQGVASSRWRRGDGTFELTASGPPHTRGAVVVPTLGHARTIARDGRTVWRRGHAVGSVSARAVPGGVRFSGQTGRRTFAWAHG